MSTGLEPLTPQLKRTLHLHYKLPSPYEHVIVSLSTGTPNVPKYGYVLRAVPFEPYMGIQYTVLDLQTSSELAS